MLEENKRVTPITKQERWRERDISWVIVCEHPSVEEGRMESGPDAIDEFRWRQFSNADSVNGHQQREARNDNKTLSKILKDTYCRTPKFRKEALIIGY